MLLGYIDRTRNANTALSAIDTVADQPALNPDMLEIYAQKKFVPTVKKVKLSKPEQLCLTQAIYHEARGESQEGQWAVANVIINRAMSRKFPHDAVRRGVPERRRTASTVASSPLPATASRISARKPAPGTAP